MRVQRKRWYDWVLVSAMWLLGAYLISGACWMTCDLLTMMGVL